MLDIHWDPKKFYQTIHTYYKYIYIYIMHWVSMLISIHSKSKYMSYIIISHQIIEENLISQQKKQQRGQAVTKFKPTKQGQIYTLQTSTYLILQTNPLPLQISNGENMKFLWVKIENDWKSEGSGSTKMDIGYFFLKQIFTSGSKTPLYKARIHLCWKKTVNLASMSEHEIQAL